MKQESFDKLLDYINLIHNKELKALTRKLLVDNEAQIKTLPASLSGNNHLGETSGDHLLRTVKFAEHFCIEFALNQDDIDVLISSAMLHDIANVFGIIKIPNPKEYQVKYDSGYYRSSEQYHTHPMVGSFIIGKLALEMHYETNLLVVATAKAVSTHMEHWVKGSPKPETDVEKFLAMSDYLASRREISIE